MSALPPFGQGWIGHGGQSLAVGYDSTAAGVTTSYGNVKLFDSSGNYTVTDPTSPTLSAIPLATPMRPDGEPTGQYPTNINGTNTAEISAAEQLTALLRASGRATAQVTATNIGQGSAPISALGPGSQNFEAGPFEVAALKRLIGNSSFGALGMLWTHGESDAAIMAENFDTSTAAYLTPLLALVSANQNAIAGITGQGNAVPLVMTQQNIGPGAYEGRNWPAAAMLQAAQLYPAYFVLAGPKYQFQPFVDTYHLLDYRQLGEKYGQVLFKMGQNNGQFTPLWPTSFSRTGTTVTIGMNIPVAPLVFDTTTFAQAHATDEFTMWAGGYGFEAWDSQVNVTACTGEGVSPIALTFDGPHNRSTGDLFVVEGVNSGVIIGGPNNNDAANGLWTVTVTGANTLTLDGSTGDNNYIGGGVGLAPIGVTAAISGSSVVLTLSRTPVSQLYIAYAEHAAGPANFGQVRYGNLRDSDPFIGLTGKTPQAVYANWLVEFVEEVP